MLRVKGPKLSYGTEGAAAFPNQMRVKEGVRASKGGDEGRTGLSGQRQSQEQSYGSEKWLSVRKEIQVVSSSYIKSEVQGVRGEAAAVVGAVYGELRLYAEDNKEGLKVFIQGKDMDEDIFYKALSKRYVEVVFKNVKIGNRETNQKALANPQERR